MKELDDEVDPSFSGFSLHFSPNPAVRYFLFPGDAASLIFCVFTVAVSDVTLSLDANRLVLSNGFIRVEFDRQRPAIDVLQASIEGQFLCFHTVAQTYTGALPPANVKPPADVRNLFGFRNNDALNRKGGFVCVLF